MGDESRIGALGGGDARIEARVVRHPTLDDRSLVANGYRVASRALCRPSGESIDGRDQASRSSGFPTLQFPAYWPALPAFFLPHIDLGCAMHCRLAGETLVFSSKNNGASFYFLR